MPVLSGKGVEIQFWTRVWMVTKCSLNDGCGRVEGTAPAQLARQTTIASDSRRARIFHRCCHWLPTLTLPGWTAHVRIHYIVIPQESFVYIIGEPSLITLDPDHYAGRAEEARLSCRYIPSSREQRITLWVDLLARESRDLFRC